MDLRRLGRELIANNTPGLFHKTTTFKGGAVRAHHLASTEPSTYPCSMIIAPKCPACESTQGFASVSFCGSEYFVLVCCQACEAVISACEKNAIAPEVEALKQDIQHLTA